MRLFHTLKDVDSALKLFKDESLGGFFDQLVSYQILLDLLYETGRYQEMLDIYKVIKERQVRISWYFQIFPRFINIMIYRFKAEDIQNTFSS